MTDFGPTLQRGFGGGGQGRLLIVSCSLTHSLLDAKMSTVRLHVIGQTWQSTLALALIESCRYRGLSMQEGDSMLQEVDVAGGSTMIADCSLMHSLLDAKMPTIGLHIVGPTWQSTFALAFAVSHGCRGSSLQGVVIAAGRCCRTLLQGGSRRCRGLWMQGGLVVTGS
jgi:hypothetical protein